MKTTDGGLHWEKISPDLTGAARSCQTEKTADPPTVQNAKERGFGVVYSHRAVAEEGRRDLGGKRYRADSSDDRWRQDVERRHAERAARLEQDRDDRGVAL